MKKEKNAPQLVSESGVLFAYHGSETSSNKMLSIIIGTIFSYAIALALIFGSLLTFTTMFAVQMHTTLFLVVTALLAFAMIILFQLPKKVVGFSMLGVLALIGLYVLIYWNEIISGFEYIRDFALIGISKAMYWTVPELSYTFNGAMKTDTTVLMILIAIPVILVSTYFTVRKINFILPFLLTFIFFEIGAAFGCVPNHYAFAALLAGWTGLFAMYAAAKIRKIKRRKKDSKKTKVTAAERRQSFIASIGIAVALLTFGTFSLSNILLGVAGYNRPENMMQLREDFKDKVSDFIDYILGIDNDGSLREGHLYQMGDRIIKNRRYMTIELPAGAQTYVRGFVGSEYKGDRWEPTKEDGDFEWLKSTFETSGYYPQNMQGKILENMEGEFPDVISSKITISNLRRKKDYAFTTYVPLLSNDFTFEGDAVAVPDDKSEYSYTAYMDSTTHYMFEMSELYSNSSFEAVWKEYTKYVHEAYTQVPKEYKEIEKIVSDLVNGTGYGLKGKAQTDLQIADRIRSYLSETIEYSLMVQKMPENVDFLEWLINDYQKGYSAHYATAMALMLRIADVPTRYVEGYVILEEDFANAEVNEDGYCSIDLTDLNAHAWLEIYDDKFGWTPVDATPGYYFGNLADEEIVMPEEEYVPPPEDNFVPEEDEQLPDMQEDPEGEVIVYEEEVGGSGGEVEQDPAKEEKKEEEEDNSLLGKILKIFKYILIFIGIVLAAFIVLALIAFSILVIRRNINMTKLEKSIKNKDYHKRVAGIYKYYNRLLKFEDIDNSESLPYLEYAKYICSKSERLRGEQHLRAMTIFLKYRFSNEMLNENELSCLENLAIEYRNNSVDSLSGKEKFRFMYIDNLG